MVQESKRLLGSSQGGECLRVCGGGRGGGREREGGVLNVAVLQWKKEGRPIMVVFATTSTLLSLPPQLQAITPPTPFPASRRSEFKVSVIAVLCMATDGAYFDYRYNTATS